MSRKKKTIVGKIGYCENSVLGITNSDGNIKGGHYVYIRELAGSSMCKVNVITSLESKDGRVYFDKIKKVKQGYLYSIPKYDGNFTQWSAINLDGNIKKIKISDIQDIGKKKIKRRHNWFVGKFTKK